MAESSSKDISTIEHELHNVLPGSQACTSEQASLKRSQELVIRRSSARVCSKKVVQLIVVICFIVLAVSLLLVLTLFKGAYSEIQHPAVTGPPSNFDIPQCGTRSRPLHPGIDVRVSGGRPVSIESWPWMASLRDEYGVHFCGATLISDSWLLTAAHCVSSITSPPLETIVMGDSQLSGPSDYHVTRVTFTIFEHPDFESATFANDIALIKVEPSIQPTEGVLPACLNDETDEFDMYSNCFIVGWGATSYADIRSDDLQEGRVPLVPLQNCSAAYDDRHVVTIDMLCAISQDWLVDTCKGDSGGPLMCENSTTNVWSVVGVTSFGYGCWNPGAPAPGVYTRVSSYSRTFIEDTIRNHTDVNVFHDHR